MKGVSALLVVGILLTCVFVPLADAREVRLPHRKRFISALIGRDANDRLLRIRFDEDKIAIYGGPSGGTYDHAAKTDVVSLGPSVLVARLPVYYTYQGDPAVRDPIQTNERVTYSGVLGLGPRSPIWTLYQFDSWRLEPDALVLGAGVPATNDSTVLQLPRTVKVDPRSDFTTVSDLRIYLTWLGTLPGAKNASGNETLHDALLLLSQAGGTHAAKNVSSGAAEELLNAHLKIYSRTSRSGGGEFGYGRSAPINSAMILLPEASMDGIEMDAYTVDSVSGNYVELVRFVPEKSTTHRAENPLALVSRRDPLSSSSGAATPSPILSVGLIHASDWVIVGSASLETVLLSPAPSGPFSPQASDFVWLFFSCLILGYLFEPGLSERFQRARRLFMPFSTLEEYHLELARAHEDWTLVLLAARIVLALSAWVMHFSLAAYRPLQQMEQRGWYIAYYFSMAYIIWCVVVGPIHYPDRHSVSRYAIALRLAAVLLLSVHYWNGLCLLLMVVISFDCARLALDRCLSNFIRYDSAELHWLRITQFVSVGESIWLTWMFGFYVLDRVIRSTWPGVRSSVLVELCVTLVSLTMFSVTASLLEESIRIAADARYLSSIFNERLGNALSATKETKSRLASSIRTVAGVPSNAPSGSCCTSASVVVGGAGGGGNDIGGSNRYHFGMGLPAVETAAAAIVSGTLEV